MKIDKLKNSRLWKIAGKVLNVIYWTMVTATGVVVLYIVLLFTVFDTFHVPTSSMTPTLKPGTRGIINKLKMGGRYFDVYAAAAGRPHEVRRMPGYGRLEKGDIIVFNAPFTGSWDTVAMDMRRYYCKRAVGVAGDTLEVRKGHYRVSGFDGVLGVDREQETVRMVAGDIIRATPERGDLPGWVRCGPGEEGFGWTILNMGPLVIPSQGMEMDLNRKNTIFYKKYIEWETGESVVWDDSTARIGGRPVSRYSFRENYCFAAGDHAIDSQDSRYFGLVPEKFIVGTVSLYGDLGF